VEYTNSGKFEDPLQNTSAKATVFNDTSNNKPKKINCNINMNKKLIRLTEQDLHRIVKESVNGVLNEGFWGNMGSAIRGAYNGYQANQSMQNNARYGNTSNIAKYINDLYEQVGWFAEEFNKKGNEMLDGRGYYRVQNLQKLINAIAQEFRTSSQSYRERENMKNGVDNF
jgi:hypothetical protein